MGRAFESVGRAALEAYEDRRKRIVGVLDDGDGQARGNKYRAARATIGTEAAGDHAVHGVARSAMIVRGCDGLVIVALAVARGSVVVRARL